MKHQAIIFISVGLVFFFVLLNIDIRTPTGAATSETHAKSLDHVVDEFFNIETIKFPNGACGQIVKDIYNNIALTPLDVKTGFMTEGYEKIASLNFVTDRTRRFGTMDLVYGASTLAADNADSMIATSVSSVVAVPKRSRANFVNMDLYGHTINGVFYVNKGRFSIPSTECIFVVSNGDAFCECDSHAIASMEIAGITAARPPQGDYEKLMERIGLR